MSADLGFAAPVTRRGLTALRGILSTIKAGDLVTATFRTTEHGRFSVTGPVRRDVTDTVFKVGWWDLTTGRGTEPVLELQSLTTVEAVEGAGSTDSDTVEVVAAIGDLHAGDIVTAVFGFEGCGTFAVSGAVKRDNSGTKWTVAAHQISLSGLAAPRLRRLAILYKATAERAESESYDLFGVTA